MIDLKPCAICGGNSLVKYRYNILVPMDFSKSGYYIEDNPEGEMFRIECECGCKFDKCQDYLFEKAEDIFGCDAEILDEDLWNVFISEWNRPHTQSGGRTK